MTVELSEASVNDALAEQSMRLAMVPLSLAALWEDNPRVNDLFGLIGAIRRYGFQDPPRYMQSINDGRGGLSRGNGRTLALQRMYEQGMDRPAGIGIVINHAKYNGEWAVPVLFGTDVDDELMAMAFALDDNNAVLAGGDFTDFFISQTYDEEAYTAMVRRLLEEEIRPITVDEHALTTVADAILTSTGNKVKPAKTTARVRFGEFIIKVPIDDFDAWYAELSEETGGDKAELRAEIEDRLDLTRFMSQEEGNHEG